MLRLAVRKKKSLKGAKQSVLCNSLSVQILNPVLKLFVFLDNYLYAVRNNGLRVIFESISEKVNIH
jgi:hypothetical protein